MTKYYVTKINCLLSKNVTDMQSRKYSLVCQGCIDDLTWFGFFPQPVLGAQRGPVVAMGSVKGKGHEGAVGSVTAKPATGVRPVASVALATSRQNATPAIWYVRVGSQKVWHWAGADGVPACPSSCCPHSTQLVLAPVPDVQDLRNQTVCNARRAGPCTTSSV